jgi:HAD superfamily hydrolase (TIGR01490 family)
MRALATSATARVSAATTAGVQSNSRGSARVTGRVGASNATSSGLPKANSRVVVASVATTRDAVVSHAAAPAAKVVYDTVLYSFAQDGSATILTRADLDAVHAAMHVNAMSTENNGTTQDTETTTVADAAIDDALVSIDEGECEEACPLVFGEPEPAEPEIATEKKETEAVLASTLSQTQVDQSLGDAAGIGASAYSSDDVLCMMYGVDMDKEDAKHKVAFFSVDGAVMDSSSLRAAAIAAAKPGTSSDDISNDSSNFFQNIWSAIVGAFKGPTNESVAAVGPGVFAGVAAGDVEKIANRVHAEHLANAVYPEAARYAKQLRYDGYKIVLVTSQPAWLLAPLAELMGASRVVGSDLAIDSDGKFTGEFDNGDAMAGDVLKARIESFAARVGVDLAKSIVYGNGDGDLPLMKACGKAYAVSPEASSNVARAADENGWNTLGWREDSERKAARDEEAAAMDNAMEAARVNGTLQPAYAAVTANGTSVSAKSRAWVVSDPDQYDPENDRRRG